MHYNNGGSQGPLEQPSPDVTSNKPWSVRIKKGGEIWLREDRTFAQAAWLATWRLPSMQKVLA